ncbi:MAG: hypothetical protein LBD03_04960 [Methanobrevibacter sp.]|jgi:hypothetical protein|nr:hypothetical protein [Candidatus Methanovirga procula]
MNAKILAIFLIIGSLLLSNISALNYNDTTINLDVNDKITVKSPQFGFWQSEITFRDSKIREKQYSLWAADLAIADFTKCYENCVTYNGQWYDDKNNLYKSYTVNKQFSFAKSELPSSPC